MKCREQGIFGELGALGQDDTKSRPKLRPARIFLGDAGMAQWWEHSPPTNVARVRFPDPASYVG